MIVYNLTIQVEGSMAHDWLNWQKAEHIPETMHTGLFEDYKIYRLLEPDDQQGPTYTIQYFASSEENYRKYLDEFAPLLRQKAFARWGNKFIAHRTLMELVH
jgi:hypothetical protein